jgi:molybdopterin converting factor small subunit
MIEIHLCGTLRRLVEDSSASEDTVMMVGFEEGETFRKLIERIGIEKNKIGDCFVNGVLAKEGEPIRDGDRIGLFPFNMVLIDGGIHLKFHPNRR